MTVPGQYLRYRMSEREVMGFQNFISAGAHESLWRRRKTLEAAILSWEVIDIPHIWR